MASVEEAPPRFSFDPHSFMTNDPPDIRAAAQRMSERIDEELKAERKAKQQEDKTTVKVLLLGQSESGKSTALKNFRMAYAREEWQRERASWKAVIQLNLIRSIITILDLVQDVVNTESQSRPSSPILDNPTSLRVLSLRLIPLRGVEKDLKRVLGAGSSETEEGDAREFQVAIRKWSDLIHSTFHGTLDAKQKRDLNDPAGIIASCKDDITTLWEDEGVREVLYKANVDLANTGGFFLTDLDRVAQRDYEPTDDDIVRARLRTIGVQEYRIKFPKVFGAAAAMSYDWLLYDVGGSRTVRRVWIPFFENVDAIIFLAPLSCFDEVLAEDSEVNRLDDSLEIWKGISSSPLLARTTLVLFLNKCDLLHRKLERRRVKASRFVEGYVDPEENQTKHFIKFIREKFKNILRDNTPDRNRPYYMYATSLTDTSATSNTLLSVKDSLLKGNLKTADLV